jgi:hypothetical protein
MWLACAWGGRSVLQVARRLATRCTARRSTPRHLRGTRLQLLRAKPPRPSRCRRLHCAPASHCQTHGHRHQPCAAPLRSPGSRRRTRRHAAQRATHQGAPTRAAAPAAPCRRASWRPSRRDPRRVPACLPSRPARRWGQARPDEAAAGREACCAAWEHAATARLTCARASSAGGKGCDGPGSPSSRGLRSRSRQ